MVHGMDELGRRHAIPEKTAKFARRGPENDLQCCQKTKMCNM